MKLTVRISMIIIVRISEGFSRVTLVRWKWTCRFLKKVYQGNLFHTFSGLGLCNSKDHQRFRQYSEVEKLRVLQVFSNNSFKRKIWTAISIGPLYALWVYTRKEVVFPDWEHPATKIEIPQGTGEWSSWWNMVGYVFILDQLFCVSAATTLPLLCSSMWRKTDLSKSKWWMFGSQLFKQQAWILSIYRPRRSICVSSYLATSHCICRPRAGFSVARFSLSHFFRPASRKLDIYV